MITINDMEVLEGLVDADEAEATAAMQRAINSGECWMMQGSYGRAAMAAIKAGRNMLGAVSRRDYYGNRIPSRDDVVEGTPGSREFVVSRYGEAHADALGRA